MSTIDQQFVEYIVKSLVGHPDDVVVDRLIDEKGVLLSLTVNPEDLGRVIGKRGVTAQSLRTLLRALGTKNDARYNLKIINNDDQRDNYATSSENQPSDVQPSESESPEVQNDEPDEPDEPVKNSTDETVDNDPDYANKAREELAELDDLDI
ncbi:MAG TPA: KH domain-containing protein [Candidatus Angelobacter sp.]|nr:KH domain-containing protein [Candidatus Angelobacter sp.]